MDERLMKANEVAEMLAINLWTLYGWIKDGTAPPPLVVGKSYRWRLSDVDAWLDSQYHYREAAAV